MVDIEPVLSICISTYNRARRVEKIIKHILQIKSYKFNIVVVDDCSTDNTIECLNSITDNRLMVYKNKKNYGAKRNWYETIDHGNGKYLLHVLDRDWVNNYYINRIIEILENLDVGFGYIGNYLSMNENKKNGDTVAIYEKGEEALCEFACTLVHPTGFLVRKDCWQRLSGKKKFFESNKYGIYPHSYINALLADSENSISIRYNMFEMSNYSQMTVNISHFYKKSEATFWWMPKAHELEISSIIEFICSSDGIDRQIIQHILLNRFKENLYMATFLYKNEAMDITNAKHYGISIEYVEYEELVDINDKFVQKFLDNMKRNGILFFDINFEKNIQLIKENNKINIIDGMEKHKDILEMAKYKRYYCMMDAWVELIQKGIRLDNILREYKIVNIAIYGNGKFCKKLREELRNTTIKVKYLIDKNADRMIEDIPIVTLDETLPAVDAIIVTILGEYNLIKKQLNHICDYNILSLEDIVYDCFE